MSVSDSFRVESKQNAPLYVFFAILMIISLPSHRLTSARVELAKRILVRAVANRVHFVAHTLVAVAVVSKCFFPKKNEALLFSESFSLLAFSFSFSGTIGGVTIEFVIFIL